MDFMEHVISEEYRRKLTHNNVNDNVVLNKTNNDNVRASNIDRIASILMQKLQDPEGKSWLYYRKVGWALPENKIWLNVEKSQGKVSPGGYFHFLCDKDMNNAKGTRD